MQPEQLRVWMLTTKTPNVSYLVLETKGFGPVNFYINILSPTNFNTCWIKVNIPQAQRNPSAADFLTPSA
jgi:hypothetical protein